jgi:hypothetical protein
MNKIVVQKAGNGEMCKIENRKKTVKKEKNEENGQKCVKNGGHYCMDV